MAADDSTIPSMPGPRAEFGSVAKADAYNKRRYEVVVEARGIAE